MRIADANLPYFSIVWFGVDVAGKIIAFLSLGDGNIPEFVKQSEEETMKLFHYWYGRTDLNFSHAFDFRNKIDKDVFLEKGVYVCVSADPYEGKVYRLVGIPSNPTHLHDLTIDIKEILCTHKLPVDITQCNDVVISDVEDD